MELTRISKIQISLVSVLLFSKVSLFPLQVGQRKIYLVLCMFFYRYFDCNRDFQHLHAAWSEFRMPLLNKCPTCPHKDTTPEEFGHHHKYVYAEKMHTIYFYKVKQSVQRNVDMKKLLWSGCWMHTYSELKIVLNYAKPPLNSAMPLVGKTSSKEYINVHIVKYFIL